ncbi:MAG: hypothetical protein JST80_11975 [Bdellovibrionales bacterium]|nr:hypothetical protein [Bdellovibrionales bacterium]
MKMKWIAAILLFAFMSCGKKPETELLGGTHKRALQTSVAGADSSPAVSVPNQFNGTIEVIAQGKMGSYGRVRTQESGGAVMSTLEGTITLTRIQMQPQVSIHGVYLMNARNITVTSPNTSCVFSVKNFGTIQPGVSTLSFTLVGIDNNRVVANDPTGCYLTLRQVSQGHLEVRFEGATSVLPANANSLPLNTNLNLQVR